MFISLLLVKLKKQYDLTLTVLFFFCFRKLQSSWIWFDKLCSKRSGSCWYYSENNCFQIWETMEMYLPRSRCRSNSESWTVEAKMPKFITHIFLKSWTSFRNHYISRDKYYSSRKAMAKCYEHPEKMVRKIKFRQGRCYRDNNQKLWS